MTVFCISDSRPCFGAVEYQLKRKHVQTVCTAIDFIHERAANILRLLPQVLFDLNDDQDVLDLVTCNRLVISSL